MIVTAAISPADTVINVYTKHEYTYHGRCLVEGSMNLSFEGVMLQSQTQHTFLVIPIDTFETRYKTQ